MLSRQLVDFGNVLDSIKTWVTMSSRNILHGWLRCKTLSTYQDPPYHFLYGRKNVVWLSWVAWHQRQGNSESGKKKKKKPDQCKNLVQYQCTLSTWFLLNSVLWNWIYLVEKTASAAAKSLQSCPTLCDPIDGSPPGSPIPGILQARTLEWVDISFSNAWKWKVKVKSLSRVRLLATPWTAAHQAPPSMGFSRQEYWSGLPLPSPSREDYWLSTRMFSKVFCIQGDSWVTYSCTFIFQGDLLSEAIKTISIEEVG